MFNINSWDNRTYQVGTSREIMNEYMMNTRNHKMKNTVILITKKKKKKKTKETTTKTTQDFHRALLFFVLLGASIMINGNRNMHLNIPLFVRGEEIITEVRTKKKKSLVTTCTYRTFHYYRVKQIPVLPVVLPVYVSTYLLPCQ